MIDVEVLEVCDIRSKEELKDEIGKRVRASRGEIGGVIELLERFMSSDGLVQPTDEDAWFVLRPALKSLEPYGALHQAWALTVWLYHHICGQQQETDERQHKGSVTYQAGLISLRLRQPHEAFWYIFLAFIEDVISNLPDPSVALAAPAARTLRSVFAVRPPTLTEAAETTREISEQDGNLTKFPESIALALALSRQLPTPLDVGTEEIPLNPHLVRVLLARLDEGGASPTETGDRLEYLAAYLLMTLPGAHVVSKSRTPDHEIDLIITQRTSRSSYLLDALGRSFIVECKNWAGAVGVEALNHFVSKMRFHRCRCGILFSKKGISGKGETDDPRFARLTRLRWFHQDACIVLTVAQADIGSLLERSKSVGELLLDKYEKLRFSRINPDVLD